VITGAVFKVCNKLGGERGFTRKLVNLHCKHLKQSIGTTSKQNRIKMQAALGNGVEFPFHKVTAL